MFATCAGCRRHVRVNDAYCPFCATPVDVSRTVPGTNARMNRAALFAFTSTMALTGCSTTDLGGSSSVYGGPPYGPDTSRADVRPDLGVSDSALDADTVETESDADDAASDSADSG